MLKCCTVKHSAVKIGVLHEAIFTFIRHQIHLKMNYHKICYDLSQISNSFLPTLCLNAVTSSVFTHASIDNGLPVAKKNSGKKEGEKLLSEAEENMLPNTTGQQTIILYRINFQKRNLLLFR